MIKLSDFKQVTKYNFVNRILQPTISKKLNMEEIEIKSINKEVIENFNKIFEQNKDMTNEELLFISIEVLSNVEVDTEYKEFIKMLSDYSNVELISFCNLIIERISDVIKSAEMVKGNQEVILETNKIDDIMSKMKVVK